VLSTIGFAVDGRFPAQLVLKKERVIPDRDNVCRTWRRFIF
jgi:hypothetical protein